MAEKKHANFSFRTQAALKEQFEKAFEKQAAYGSVTGYFEDCMRALIVATRSGQEFAPPLQFIIDEPTPVKRRARRSKPAE